MVANANQFWVQVCPSHMDPVHLPKDLVTQHWLLIRNPRNRFRGFTLSISVTFPRPWLRDVIRKGMGESTNIWSYIYFEGKGKNETINKYETYDFQSPQLFPSQMLAFFFEVWQTSLGQVQGRRLIHCHTKSS